jgi:DNA-binding transcriptional MerR regulator
MGRRYRVGEVARLFAVSVRALHHYDERGLLVPSARSDAGYRLYSEADLTRLAEILALRALGVRLDRIAALLTRPEADPERALRLRRLVVRRQMADLAAQDAAIGEALAGRGGSGEWSWETVRSSFVSRPLDQELEEIMDKHFTAEQLAAFERLGQEAGPEEIAAAERAWAALIPEVRAARAARIDPASPEAQALGQRWRELVDRSFRGETALHDAVGAAYQAGVFAGDPALPNDDDFDFITAVEEARRT